MDVFERTPIPGDRIEVVMSSNDVLCRGVLVAQVMGFYDMCFVHCDPVHGEPARGATYRRDQVRCEPSPADRLEIIDYETGLGIVELLRKETVPNVADQIKTETTDGLRRDDPVDIRTTEGKRKISATGRFVAEFKGKRYVIFDSGGSGAYPAKDVTKR